MSFFGNLFNNFTVDISDIYFFLDLSSKIPYSYHDYYIYDAKSDSFFELTLLLL